MTSRPASPANGRLHSRASGQRPRFVLHVRGGLTLVEVLVVIAIIGVLVGLLLPAAQSARESARRNTCVTNIKQLALGSLQHEQAFGFLPTGGWGWRWVGDPDRGFDKRQTGGWAFNLLPFIEQAAIRDLGAGMQDTQAKADKAVERLTKPLAVFNCPTRRPPKLWAVTPGREFRVVSVPREVMRRVDAVVRGDYAANMGSGAPPFVYQSGGSPDTVQIGDMATDQDWINYFFNAYPPPRAPDGVIFRRSMIRLRDVTDGTSKTYLFGEKYLDPALIESGNEQGDDQCLYAGHDRDVLRVGFVPPYPDTPGFDPYNAYPTSQETDPKPIAFGSAHPATCGMAMVDGSVRTIDYGIAQTVHQGLASRNDGQP